jgi:hypothetical protein
MAFESFDAMTPDAAAASRRDVIATKKRKTHKGAAKKCYVPFVPFRGDSAR